MLSEAKHLLFFTDSKQKQILRGVYPELLRCAQDRLQQKSERAQDDMIGGFVTAFSYFLAQNAAL